MLTLTSCGLALSAMMLPPATGQEKVAVERAVPSGESLAKSLQTWQELKVKCGGNYSYTVAFASGVGLEIATWTQRGRRPPTPRFGKPRARPPRPFGILSA
jgi:hypothetical protein